MERLKYESQHVSASVEIKPPNQNEMDRTCPEEEEQIYGWKDAAVGADRKET